MQNMKDGTDESVKTIKANAKFSPDKSGKSAKPLKSSAMLQDADEEMEHSEPIDWPESPVTKSSEQSFFLTIHYWLKLTRASLFRLPIKDSDADVQVSDSEEVQSPAR